MYTLQAYILQVQLLSTFSTRWTMKFFRVGEADVSKTIQKKKKNKTHLGYRAHSHDRGDKTLRFVTRYGKKTKTTKYLRHNTISKKKKYDTFKFPVVHRKTVQSCTDRLNESVRKKKREGKLNLKRYRIPNLLFYIFRWYAL